MPQRFKLIDVLERCLAEPQDPVESFALSYIWGRDQENKTTLANLNQRSKPSQLSMDDLWLPQTLTDSMCLSFCLGARYNLD